MKVSKILKRLGLFLAAYITYAIVLNLSVFDAKPTELVVSYEQGEALSAEHYRRLGLEYLDRDAEEAGRERFAQGIAGGERMPVPDNELINGLSTGTEGWTITRYSTDFSELMRIAAMDENGEIFDSAAWQELNRRLANTDWRRLGASSLDAQSFYYFSLEIGSLSPVDSRLWQLVYIIRNQDENALADWMAQQMELVEYPNTFIDLALASLFSPEVIRELLDLEFLSPAMRSDLTTEVSAFSQRIEANRGEIWAGVRERETRLVVGWVMTASAPNLKDVWGGVGVSDATVSTIELMSLVFAQPQRSKNRLVDNLDRLQHGVLNCPGRSFIEQLLWPQNLIGEILIVYACEATNSISPYPRYEQRWNTYVDSLVEFRAELVQAQ